MISDFGIMMLVTYLVFGAAFGLSCAINCLIAPTRSFRDATNVVLSVIAVVLVASMLISYLDIYWSM